MWSLSLAHRQHLYLTVLLTARGNLMTSGQKHVSHTSRGQPIAARHMAVAIPPEVIMPARRPPEDADAQALRAAVILDELDFPGFDQPDERTGCIVVEVTCRTRRGDPASICCCYRAGFLD